MKNRAMRIGTMYLEVGSLNSLDIKVLGESRGFIGTVSFDGECHILCTSIFVSNYEYWIEQGRKTDDTTTIHWKGKDYAIIDSVLRCLTDSTNVYDFGTSSANDACTDNNIMRMKSGKPILF